MVKISKSNLLKTIAMGALLTNGCIGAQNDKKDGLGNQHAASSSSSSTSSTSLKMSPKLSARLITANSSASSNGVSPRLSASPMRISSDGTSPATMSPRGSSSAVVSPQDEMMESILTDSFVDRTLESRRATIRKALEAPQVFNFQDGRNSVSDILNLLHNARIHSKDSTDPIKVNITLNNIHPSQLKLILEDENKEHIGTIKHTLLASASPEDDDNDAISDDALKSSKRRSDGKENDLKKDHDDDDDEDDEDLKKPKRRHYGLNRDNSQKHPRMNVRAARARQKLLNSELLKDSKTGSVFLPVARLVVPVHKENLGNVFQPVQGSWAGTTKVTLDNNNDHKNLGTPNVNSRGTPPNLVRIFCKRDSSVPAPIQSAG